LASKFFGFAEPFVVIVIMFGEAQSAFCSLLLLAGDVSNRNHVRLLDTVQKRMFCSDLAVD
jgi:hypothetical protein